MAQPAPGPDAYRTALVNRLRAARSQAVIAIVAPTGYGKTTLLAQWRERDDRPFVDRPGSESCVVVVDDAHLADGERLAALIAAAPEGSTVVLASPELLEDDHGTNYIAWELRGGRVCIETRAEAAGKPPPGVRYVVVEGSRHKPPFKGLRLRKVASPYVLWEVKGPVAKQSVCPLIAVRQARQGPAR